MNPYLVMTLAGVAAKTWFFWHLTRNWRDTRLHRLLLALALVLLAQSGCELLLYAFAGGTGAAGYWSLIGYYIFTFGTIALLPFIAVEIVERRPNPYLTVIAITAGTAVVALLLFTRTIIADVTPMHYSLTRVPGPYYWVFQLSALLTVLFTVVTLAGARRSANLFVRAKATNLLLAFLPVFVFAVTVVIAMQMGLKFNAVGILPLCFVIYVAALLQHTDPHRIPDYTLYIPWSKKARLVRELTRHVRSINRDGVTPDARREYQDVLTQYALDIHGGNQTQAAQWLKVSQSWVSRKRKGGNV